MDSDIQKQLASAAQKLSDTQTIVSDVQEKPPKIKNRPKKITPQTPIRQYWILGGIIIIACLLAFILFAKTNHTAKQAPTISSIVPEDMQKKVTFPVYYPNPDTLPTGYVLDKDSFSATNEVVLYSVNYDTDKKIVFTLQKKPATDELDIFYKNQIPLRTEIEVPLGKLAIGMLNNQRFLSLPTKTDVWLIITAPMEAEQGALLELAKNLKQ